MNSNKKLSIVLAVVQQSNSLVEELMAKLGNLDNFMDEIEDDDDLGDNDDDNDLLFLADDLDTPRSVWMVKSHGTKLDVHSELLEVEQKRLWLQNAEFEARARHREIQRELQREHLKKQEEVLQEIARSTAEFQRKLLEKL